MSILGNLRQARFSLQEWAGGFGDLGTFLPLLTGLSVQCGLDFAGSLFFAGVANLITGMSFAIPMAVQPMKAIAAVALTQGLSPGQIVAAGVMVSGFVLLLGVSGWLGYIQRHIPMPVIRGLQLGLGLTLAVKAFGMLRSSESLWIALAAGLGVMLFLGSRRLPAALLLFGVGLVLAALQSGQAPVWGLWLPAWHLPVLADFSSAFMRAALPQIPLTVLNSVVAVCALSAELYPSHAASPRKVAISVGLMNFVGAPFGAMPLCHGAGGLAAQHRFGARSNGSILMLGVLKILAALCFGAALMPLLKAFPSGILAVMLLVSGLELSMSCAHLKGPQDFFPALVTASACLAAQNPAVGLVLGLGVHHAARLGWMGFTTPEITAKGSRS
jgi:MFS superfamily sulfate permease-like transporter